MLSFSKDYVLVKPFLVSLWLGLGSYKVKKELC
jgi:hypothetical protein